MPHAILLAVGTGIGAAALTPWLRHLVGTSSAWVRYGTHVLLALLGGAGVATLAHGWDVLAFAVVVVACALLVVIDLAAYRLPDVIIGPACLLLFAALTIASAADGDWSRLGRAAAAAGILLVTYFVLAYISPSGLGLGDVKLAGLLGGFLGWLGWSQLFLGTLAAFVLGGLFGLVLLLTGRANRHTDFPFGPWMVAGAAVGAGWGAGLLG